MKQRSVLTPSEEVGSGARFAELVFVFRSLARLITSRLKVKGARAQGCPTSPRVLCGEMWETTNPHRNIFRRPKT